MSTTGPGQPAGDPAGERYPLLLELIRQRRSIRRFQPRPVPPELLEQVLEAARWAPSAGNRQAFRLLVVSEAATIAGLARAVREACQQILAGARPDRVQELAAYLRHFDHFEGAPLLLVPIYRSGGPQLIESERPSIEALSSVAAAIQNLLLAAHALGLGSCWMTGPLVAEAALRQQLAIPEGWAPAALLPLGYPAETPPAPPRRPLAQLVRQLEEKGP